MTTSETLNLEHSFLDSEGAQLSCISEGHCPTSAPEHDGSQYTGQPGNSSCASETLDIEMGLISAAPLSLLSPLASLGEHGGHLVCIESSFCSFPPSFATQWYITGGSNTHASCCYPPPTQTLMFCVVCLVALFSIFRVREATWTAHLHTPCDEFAQP